MRKIDISDYTIEERDDKENVVKKTYPVKKSLCNIFMHPQLGLTGIEIVDRGKTYDKIMGSNGHVLLEDDEFNNIEMAFKIVKGLGIHERELSRRVFKAETVEVEEKNKK